MSNASIPSMFGPQDGPPVEREIALDIVRRSLPFIPFIILLAAIPWGTKGSASAAYAIALVLANFVLAAALLTWAARISFAALGAAALFGYLIRLGLITIAVLVVRNQPWVNLVAMGITIVVTHLGLLLWEMRFISTSLAYPGLKPGVRGTTAAPLVTPVATPAATPVSAHPFSPVDQADGTRPVPENKE
jgi:hypothetical protein